MKSVMNLASRLCIGGVVVGLVACGGQSQSNTADADAPALETRSLTGAASKGPMQQATITLETVDGQGFGVDDLNSGSTDSQGQFVFGSVPASIPLLVSTDGGFFIDEADTRTPPRMISFSDGEGLLGYVPEGAITVTVSVYTDFLVRKARAEAAGGNFTAVMENNRTHAINAFGFDVLTVVPTDPLNPAADATADARAYAQVLGGLANAIAAIATELDLDEPSFAVIDAVAEDFSDGRLDGVNDGTPVMVTLPDNSTVPLPQTIRINNQIKRFYNNNPVYADDPLQTVDEDALAQSGAIPNNPPVAVDDDYSVAQSGSLTIAAPGVLANDSDPEPYPLSVQLLTGPSEGVLNLQSDGSFNYSHSGGAIALDSFTYQVTDGSALSNVATSTITINVPPTINNQSVGVDENAALGTNVGTVMANDANNDALVYSITAGNINNSFAIDNNSGVLTVADNTVLDFELMQSFTLTVTVTDTGGLTDTAQVVVDINDVNEPPTIVKNAFVVQQNEAYSISSDDIEAIDPEGGSLTFTVIGVPVTGMFSVNSFTSNDIDSEGVLFTQNGSVSPRQEMVALQVSDGVNVVDFMVSIEVVVNVFSRQSQFNGVGGNAVSSQAQVAGCADFGAFQSFATNLGAQTPGQVYHYDTNGQGTALASVDEQGNEANTGAEQPALNFRGDALAFVSGATSFVTDPNPQGVLQVWLKDFVTDELRIISFSDGGCGNGPSEMPVISADGSSLVFKSAADNLTGLGSTPTLLRLSLTEPDALPRDVLFNPPEAGSETGFPSVSADGRLVAFESTASNLVAGDVNGASDVFVVDVDESFVLAVSDVVNGSGASSPSMSGAGDRVAFVQIVGGRSDAYVMDLLTGNVARVNTTAGGAASSLGDVSSVNISGDGRFVVFASNAPDLDGDNTNASSDVFVKALPAVLPNGDALGAIVRLDEGNTDQQTNGASVQPRLSYYGRLISLDSTGDNLVANDINAVGDAFVALNELYVEETARDSDGDGLTDVVEKDFGTNPFLQDTDGDFLSDFDEVNRDNDATTLNVIDGGDTDPFNPDTDLDDVGDSIEIEFLSNPHVANSVIYASANNGNDSNDGSEWVQAVQTQAAVSNLLTGGSFELPQFVLYETGFYDAIAINQNNTVLVGRMGPGRVTPMISLDVCPALFGGVITQFSSPNVSSVTVQGANNIGLHSLDLCGSFGVGIDGPSFISTGLSAVMSANATVKAIHTNIGGHFDGGGVLITDGASVTLADSYVFSNNSANPDGGGGALVLDGQLVVERSIFADNQAENSGGAVSLINQTSVLSLSDSALLGNHTPGNGGAVHVLNGSLNVFNNIFVGNFASNNGGAILIESIDSLIFNSNTLQLNQAGGAGNGVAGGMVINQAPALFQVIRDNIIYFNDDGNLSDLEQNYVSAAGTSGVNFNNIQNALGAGNNGFDIDPLFVGGAYLNQQDSAMVDADSQQTAAAAGLDGPFTTDPDGIPDTGALDLGFHYDQPAIIDNISFAGAEPADPFSFGVDCNAEVKLIGSYMLANGFLHQPGHVISVVPSQGAVLGTTVSSITAFEPAGLGSALAVELGFNRFAFSIFVPSPTFDSSTFVDLSIDGLAPFTIEVPLNGQSCTQ